MLRISSRLLKFRSSALRFQTPKKPENAIVETTTKTDSTNKIAPHLDKTSKVVEGDIEDIGIRQAAINVGARKHTVFERIRNVSLFFITLGASYFVFYKYNQMKQEELEEKLLTEEEKAKNHYKKMEHIDIGQQEFSLRNCKDMNGPRVTGADFKGKWHLVYFGFTHCPDICPSELEKMTDVLTILDEDVEDYEDKYNQIIPVFITIDPNRDTPENILKYWREAFRFCNKGARKRDKEEIKKRGMGAKRDNQTSFTEFFIRFFDFRLISLFTLKITTHATWL